MDMKMGKILCLIGAVFGFAGIFIPALTAAFIVGGLGCMERIGGEEDEDE